MNIGTSIELYRKVYLIRKSEEAIIKYYGEDEMKTPMHMSMGSEALLAGICQALQKGDMVFGTYRSHALFLASTLDVKGFFAEMYGKVTGVARGKSGSMHLSSPENGLMICSAVVASTIPVAIGAAFAMKRKKLKNISAVFFGDGALDEGNFWESLNAACAMRLPVLFVCEDNGLAVDVGPESRQGYGSISNIITQFHCRTMTLDATDAEKVFALGQNARETILADQTPCFLRLKYYRYLEHVGVKEDFQLGYRSKDEFDKWRMRDPVDIEREFLISNGMPNEDIVALEEEIDRQIEDAVAEAKAASLPDAGELYENVFSEVR